MEHLDLKLNPKQPTLNDKLLKLGLRTDWDYALHLPLRYEDLSTIISIKEAKTHSFNHRQSQPVQVHGVISDVEVQIRPRRQLIARLSDSTGDLFLRWIHFYPNLMMQLKNNPALSVYGEIRQGFYGLEMVHPKLINTITSAVKPTLTPVYPSTAGVSQSVLRKKIECALKKIDYPELIPEPWLRRLGLCYLKKALNDLHYPPSNEPHLLSALETKNHPAWRRIQFEELLAQQLSLKQAHKQRALRLAPTLNNINVNYNVNYIESFLKQLPFELTKAQVRVWSEIKTDLNQAYPMNRLLQGDVGSGKTVVALLTCLYAIEHGLQAALMAPTEILAQQHYERLLLWLSPLGIQIVLLIGSLSKKNKDLISHSIAQGTIHLVVGTHALIEDSVSFLRLGVVVVDEQHRFGVSQRLKLRDKGFNGLTPHLLMMSATPIPRTLAMTYLSDLDVSIIDELPPHRTPIQTMVMSDNKRDSLIYRLKTWLSQGKQVYWVCPLIEDNEDDKDNKKINHNIKNALNNVTDTYERLKQELAPYQVGLIHGQLKSNDKHSVIELFALSKIQVLVATTVVEVGVDIPNASLMIVENAERFGLSQLHQLRGRVGRGTEQSICILLYGEAITAIGQERLNIMRLSNDGFLIAQKDLELRGCGDFLGARQSGQALLRFTGNVPDESLLVEAQACADELLKHNPKVVPLILKQWLFNQDGFLNA